MATTVNSKISSNKSVRKLLQKICELNEGVCIDRYKGHLKVTLYGKNMVVISTTGTSDMEAVKAKSRLKRLGYRVE